MDRHLAETITAALLEALADHTDGSSVGVFFPLPEDLASEFPSREGHDDSRPHVTALYIGEVPSEKRDALVKVVQSVLADTLPFELSLDAEPSYFPATEHSDNCVVAKLDVISDGLHALHARLKDAVKAAGIDVDDHFDEYVPHATLEYLEPPKEEYDGLVPSGSWTPVEAEVWGWEQPVAVKMGI